MAWSSTVGDIKARILAIDDNGAAGASRDLEYLTWLDFVQGFIVLFGLDYVPGDIKIVVNAVEDEVGVERTVWNL